MSRVTPVVCLSLLACNQPLGAPEGRDAQSVRVSEGDLVVSELMIAPAADCAPENGQWIELTNVGDTEVDLGELDLVTAAGTAAVDSDETLWPGDIAMIGAGDWDGFCRGHLVPQSYWGFDLELDASGVAIVDRESGLTIDTTAAFDPADVVAGASLSVEPSSLDAGLNDDPAAWYGADDCENTTGFSPSNPNAPCLNDLGWFGAECDELGCTVGSDFDPVAWLETAYWLAHGAFEQAGEADVEREGLFLRAVRFDFDETIDPDDFDPAQATWTYSFATPDFNPFGPKDFTAEVRVNEGVVVLDDDFGSDSGSMTRLDEFDAIQVGPTPIVEEIADDWWHWSFDLDYGALSWPSYKSEPTWVMVDEYWDTRLEYSATTGEEL